MVTFRMGKMVLVVPFVLFVAGCGDFPELRMISIPRLEGFRSGSRNYPPTENVTIEAFKISPCETTQGTFETVMGLNPSVGHHDRNLPVQNVTWLDSVRFCNALSKLKNYEPCYREVNREDFLCDSEKNGFRLPTSCEWEYACRGNEDKPYFWGENRNQDYCVPPLSPSDLAKIDNKLSHSYAKPVMSRRSNEFGLYDMAGNVAEWCQNSVRDITDVRVIRGGSWENGDWEAFQSKWRSSMQKSEAVPTVGFRIVRRER